MDGDTCRECGHSYLYHYHSEYRFEMMPDKKNVVDESMQAKYEEAIYLEEKARSSKQNLDNELERLI